MYIFYRIMYVIYLICTNYFMQFSENFRVKKGKLLSKYEKRRIRLRNNKSKSHPVIIFLFTVENKIINSLFLFIYIFQFFFNSKQFINHKETSLLHNMKYLIYVVTAYTCTMLQFDNHIVTSSTQKT